MQYICIQSCISVAVFIVPEVGLVFILYKALLNKMEYVIFFINPQQWNLAQRS